MPFVLFSLFFYFFLTTTSYASQPVIANQGMVVSEVNLASQIGANILKAGGNAIDAAVAVGYALAVVDPCCGNIGGGGFMTIHLANGKNIFINFREKAAKAAHKNMYANIKTNDASTKGYLAVAVPGTVLGLDTALSRYGTMTRKEVMQPAIELAENGFLVTDYEATRYKKFAKDFQQQSNVADIFLKDHHALQAGDVLKQKELAHTLRLIAKEGPSVFYRGSIAKAIVQASQQHHGILTLQDFADYHITFSQPLSCYYHNYTILSAPPPSSGGVTLCEILGILEHFPLKQTGLHSAMTYKEIIEAMRYGFRDRNHQLGDPAFVNNPIHKLLSKQYTKQLSEHINKQTYAPHTSHSFPHKELTDTTHFSVIDHEGNAVAVTYTLNGFFGAEVIAGNTGFFLNNEMDDFTTLVGVPNKFGLVQTDANAIASGKRPLSSMAPTIVMKHNQLYLILGSPGGPRIITAILLALLNNIDFNMHLPAAIDAPRFHFQDEPNSIDVENNALSPHIMQTLRKSGYYFKQQPPWGAVAAILVTDDKTFIGVMDKRRPDGAAIGY